MTTTTANVGELKSSKNDIYYIVSSEIVADESQNLRAKDNYGDINELVESIREHGVLVPLKGYREKDENGKLLFYVTHGLRRSRAIKILLDQGIEIKVPCIAKKRSECSPEQIVIEHFTMNTGMPLSVLEKANGIKKLASYNYSVSEIAKVLTMSENHVQNLILLASSPKAIRDAIEKGEIASSMALEIFKENKDHEKASEIVFKAIEEAKASGKTKATKKHVEKTGGLKKVTTKKEKKEKLLKVLNNILFRYDVDEKDKARIEKLINEF